MARRTNKVTLPPYITLRRILINATGQVYEKMQPFPYGLDVDYENLLRNKYIVTFEDFQKIDTGRCLSCGD